MATQGSPADDPDNASQSGGAGRFAAIDGFVKIGDFEGSATSHGHEGWSCLRGMRLCVERTTGSFISSDKAVGSVRFESIAVLKSIDGTSPKAFKACIEGKKIPKVLVHVVNVVAGKPAVTAEIELEDVNISGYAISDSAGCPAPSGPDALDEVDFRCHKIKYTVNKYDEKGGSKGKVQEEYTVGS